MSEYREVEQLRVSESGDWCQLFLLAPFLGIKIKQCTVHARDSLARPHYGLYVRYVQRMNVCMSM